MQRAVRSAMLASALAGVFATVGWASHARADGDGDREALRQARARFEEGVAEAKGGNFEAARLSFAQAYAVHPSAVVLWNLALTEEKTGRAVDALTHFKQWTRADDA